MYVTSVSSTIGATDQLVAGEYWSEEQYYNGTGTAIKITLTQDGLWTNKPVLVFAYTYQPNEPIYYSLSTANGFDFNGDLIQLLGTYENVTSIVWEGEPGPDHTVAYDGEVSAPRQTSKRLPTNFLSLL